MEANNEPNSPEQQSIVESYDLNACFEYIDSLKIDFKGKTILELGSGRGEHTAFLLKKEPRMIVSVEDCSIDFDFLMDKFRENREIIPVYYDLNLKLPKLEEKYDWIYSYGLLNTIKKPIEFINNLSSITHNNMLLGIDTNINIDLWDIIDELKKMYGKINIPLQTKYTSNYKLIVCNEKK